MTLLTRLMCTDPVPMRDDLFLNCMIFYIQKELPVKFSNDQSQKKSSHMIKLLIFLTLLTIVRANLN